jgi:SAM-dependent methyltransferase
MSSPTTSSERKNRGFAGGIRRLLVSPPGPIAWALDWIWAYVLPIKMFHGQFYAPAAELLDLTPDDELLDVACGSGSFLADEAAHVRRVAGIDISGPMTSVARRRLRDRMRSGTAQIITGDATNLPWPDQDFTAVTCLGSLEWFSRPDTALAEMHRVLRPGGRLVVTMGGLDTATTVKADDSPWGMGDWTESDAHAALAAAGFSDIRAIRVKAQDELRFFIAGKA